MKQIVATKGEYKMVRNNKPISEYIFFYFSGMIVGVPVAVFFESIFHLWFSTLGVATLIAPLVEEFAKAQSLFYRYEKSSRHLMQIGFLSGLGFGLAEFFFYIYRGVPFLIRLPAIGFHAAGTSIIGYGVSNQNTLKYYLLAVTLHFLNNLYAALGFWLPGGLTATITAYLIALILYLKHSK
jgi:RsiW-degrading membrane proteinase PrsW (M82 family)